MAADYEVTLSLTDSESFRFDIPLIDSAGQPIDLTGKTFEYVLWRDCDERLFNQTNGLSVDLPTGVVSFAPDPEMRLDVGTYQHGFRSTDEDNVTVQHFDGQVFVTEGGF